MYELTLKRRIGIFFGVIFLLIPLSIGGMYMSIDSLIEYFSYPNMIIFSSFIIYGFTLFLIVIPLVYMSVQPIFFGRQANSNVQRLMSRMITYCFICSVIVQIGFKFWFTNHLDNNGYISCKGIPSGWMPGMATKYALSEELCLKKAER